MPSASVLPSKGSAAQGATDAEYRVLALNGGGARGVLQAAFLSQLERDVGPLAQRFDMIAATSTGALVGLGVAAGIPTGQLFELYRSHARAIFEERRFAVVRRGPRYRSERLRAILIEHFGDRTLGDVDQEVVICASSLNRYQGRLFTRADRDVSLVDAALASSAAPTYFGPAVPQGSQRGYLDGGLWANDPLLIAVAYATARLDVAPETIDALSLGTGRVARGCTPADVEAMRTASLRTVRFLIEISGSLQEWGTEHLLAWLSSGSRVTRVNPELTEWVELHDAERALALLPGIAELEYEEHGPALTRWLRAERRKAPPRVPPLDPKLEVGLREAKLSRFFPARRFYAEHRDGRESISSYISMARSSLTMVSINLATGAALERIERTFAQLLEREDPVRVRVSLPDYDQDSLMESMAAILDMRKDSLATGIAETMESLLEFRRELDDSLRASLGLFLHKTIPSASAILIDHELPTGRIQLETKPYKAPLTKSWALEVEAGSEFFETMRTAYHDLLFDGDELDEDGTRAGGVRRRRCGQ